MIAILLEDLGADLVMMARLVQSQLTSAMTAFFRQEVALARKVTEKDDQVDNLLGFIEEKCFERIVGEPAGSPRSRRLRGVFRVALNLEKLGDDAVNVAEQAVHLSRLPARPMPFDLAGPARAALDALDEVITAFRRASVEKAKNACRCETELDQQYREALADTFRRLRQPDQDPAFLITNLLVAKFLERIGDSILNIGETTLFILTGQRLKLHQYLHLEQLVGTVAPAPGGKATVDVRQIWGGISGARVGRIDVGAGRRLIWKEGDRGKIEAEIRQMEEWNRIIPGLVPGVEGRVEADGRESFLGRFLDGTLLRDIYLTASWDEKLRATWRVLEAVREVWLATMVKATPAVTCVQQTRDRLPDLYAMHPRLAGLRGGHTTVFGISHRSLEELLMAAAGLEPLLAPPVSVRLHGDFNTNNIVIDAATDRVHFIDVHRSGPGDYAQDIGVLLVSNLRHPIQDAGLRAELTRLNRVIGGFAAEFARLVGDEHFEARLRLSMARSLITSGRLVTRVVDLAACGVRLPEAAVYHAGRPLAVDAAVVKKIGDAAGGWAVRERLHVLRHLEAGGVPVWSAPAAIEAAVDRARMTVELVRAGLPVPETVITEDVAGASAAVERFPSAVLKPLFTSKGRGMRRLDSSLDLPKLLARHARETPGPFYLQRFVKHPGRDLGVAVLEGECLGAYWRVADRDQWMTTILAGGRYERADVPAEVVALALRAAAHFGLLFTGVDLTESEEGHQVLEVSAFGGFRGLLDGCGIDAAPLVAGAVLRRIARQ